MITFSWSNKLLGTGACSVCRLPVRSGAQVLLLDEKSFPPVVAHPACYLKTQPDQQTTPPQRTRVNFRQHSWTARSFSSSLLSEFLALLLVLSLVYFLL